MKLPLAADQSASERSKDYGPGLEGQTLFGVGCLGSRGLGKHLRRRSRQTSGYGQMLFTPLELRGVRRARSRILPGGVDDAQTLLPPPLPHAARYEGHSETHGARQRDRSERKCRQVPAVPDCFNASETAGNNREEQQQRCCPKGRHGDQGNAAIPRHNRARLHCSLPPPKQSEGDERPNQLHSALRCDAGGGTRTPDTRIMIDFLLKFEIARFAGILVWLV